MTDATAPAVPCAIALGARGLGVAWAGAHGAAVARLRRPRALAAERARHVGHGPPVGDRPPGLAWHGERLVTSFVQPDAASLAVGLDSRPVRVADDATAVAHALARGVAHVACADAEGLQVGQVELGRGALAVAPWRVSRRRDAGTALAVVAGERGAPLVLYALSDEEALGVAHASGIRPRDVRHRLPAPCRSVHALRVGTTTAVALGYGGDRVDVALLDAEGGMRERPHRVLRVPGSRLLSPQVLWLDDRFAVAAVDEAAEALVITALHEGDGTRMSFERFGAPSAVAYYGRMLVLARLRTDGERATLALRLADRRGESVRHSEVDVTPEDTEELRRHRRARETLLRMRTASSGGYRGGGRAVRLDPDGLGLSAHDEGAVSRLRVTPKGDEMRIVLRVGPEGSDARPEGGLRRWLGRWLSRGGRARARAWRRWAGQLAEQQAGAWLARVEHVRGTLAVEIFAPAPPSAEQLQRWIREAKAAWAQGETVRD